MQNSATMGPRIDRDGRYSYHLGMVVKGTDECTLNVCAIGDPSQPNGNILPCGSSFICLGGAQENKGKEKWVIGEIDRHGVPQKGSLIEMEFKLWCDQNDPTAWSVKWRRVNRTENADEMRKADETERGWQIGR